MKLAPSRAYVYKGAHALWYCTTLTDYETGTRQVSTPLATHEAALAHAIQQTGLDTPAEHREPS